MVRFICCHLTKKKNVAKRLEKTADWDAIASLLSISFSSNGQEVTLKGRGYRERMERIVEKFKREDAKALKR